MGILLKMSGEHTLVAQEHVRNASADPRSLKLVLARGYGPSDHALVYTVSVPNLLSSRLSTELELTLEATYRNIQVADGKTSKTRGVVRNVQFSFARKSGSKKCLIVERISIDIIIVIPKLEYFEAGLDMGRNFVAVTIDVAEVQLGFEYECTRQSKFHPDATDSEVLSSMESEPNTSYD